jgi:hypothetical protein
MGLHHSPQSWVSGTSFPPWRRGQIPTPILKLESNHGELIAAGIWDQINYQDSIPAKLLDGVAKRLHPHQIVNLPGLQHGDLVGLQLLGYVVQRELPSRRIGLP